MKSVEAILFSHREKAQLIAWCLKRCQRVRLPVTGGSMRPTLKSGDHLELNPAFSKIQPGKIYLFETPNHHIYAHRLLRVSSDSDGNLLYHFKGDALFQLDPIVGRQAIFAEVSGYWRHERYHRLSKPIAWRWLTVIWPWLRLNWNQSVRCLGPRFR